MRGLVCALAVAATLCLAAASPVPFGVNSPVSSSTPEAWLIKASKFQAEHWLREHHDVRGFVADMVLVFARPGERLPATSSTRTSLGPVKEGERLAILEPGHDAAKFRRAVGILATFEDVRLLTSPRSVRFHVIAFSAESTFDYINAMDDAEPILVKEGPLTPVSAKNVESLKARVRDVYERNSKIESLIDLIDEDFIYATATYLSGEDPMSPFTTRHSMSEDSLAAGDWVESQYASYGFDTSREHFRTNYCSNVIGQIDGSEFPESIVILGAHLDDREANIANVTGRAPGANDDGSGSTMLIAAAKAIAESGIRFRRTVRIMNYCGEEQGLFGSAYHAAQARANGVDVYAMIQGDMLAVQLPGEAVGVALINRYTDPVLTEVVRGYVAAYTPELEISDQSACCSDHQPFFEEGFASAGFVEPSGYVGDPQYHDVEDVVNRSEYSTRQLTLAAKAMLASIAELAEPI